MPNHCDNDLRINGSKEDIAAFFKAVGTKDKDGLIVIDANKIIPYPQKYTDLDNAAREWEEKNKGKNNWSQRPKDGYNQGGYEWCIENWGTKWGMYDFSEVNFGKTFATVSFSTAWSPPNPIITKLGELFPKLTFTLKFYEMGAGFKGVYKVKGDEILDDQTTTYSGQRGG